MKIENYNDYKKIRVLTISSDEEILNIIKEEFENFFKEKGRYPTTQEIDQSKVMPSSRSMQRRFGGVKKVRELLGLPIHDYTKGESRSAKAKLCMERGSATEDKCLEILTTRFPIQTIHQQAGFGDSFRTDFLIYNKTKNFYIDVFYTENVNNLNSILNIKFHKYSIIKDFPVLFVCEGLLSEDIKYKTKNKKNYFPENFQVISLSELQEVIQSYTPFTLS